MVLGKMCSQCGQEDLAETVWFDDVPVKSIEEVPVVVEDLPKKNNQQLKNEIHNPQGRSRGSQSSGQEGR